MTSREEKEAFRRERDRKAAENAVEDLVAVLRRKSDAELTRLYRVAQRGTELRRCLDDEISRREAGR